MVNAQLLLKINDTIYAYFVFDVENSTTCIGKAISVCQSVKRCFICYAVDGARRPTTSRIILCV